MVVSCCIIIQPQLGQFVNKIARVLLNTCCCGWRLAVTPPCGVTFYNGLLPLVLPFWTPKKEAKKVPATSDSAGGPAQGARPLGTPKRWSSAKKAKKRRSTALFLTLFRLSPIDPSGAKFLVGVGADSISARNARVFDGASGTPPPTSERMWAVGANSVRPDGLAAAQDSCGRAMFAPTTRLKPPLCKGRCPAGAEGL